MSAFSKLVARRELLLVEMHVQRQLLAAYSAPVAAIISIDARSATMRFILGRPHLCLWAAAQLLPFLARRLPGKSGKRFARAFQADHNL